MRHVVGVLLWRRKVAEWADFFRCVDNAAVHHWGNPVLINVLMVIPQTANVVGFLKDDHIETSFEAALCRANSGHAGADDGHSFGHLLWCEERSTAQKYFCCHLSCCSNFVFFNSVTMAAASEAEKMGIFLIQRFPLSLSFQINLFSPTLAFSPVCLPLDLSLFTFTALLYSIKLSVFLSATLLLS